MHHSLQTAPLFSADGGPLHRGLLVRHIRTLLSALPLRLSVEQVADLLGVQEPTIYRWLRSWELPAYKVGATWVILRDEVCEALEERHNQAAGERR